MMLVIFFRLAVVAMISASSGSVTKHESVSPYTTFRPMVVMSAMVSDKHQPPTNGTLADASGLYSGDPVNPIAPNRLFDATFTENENAGLVALNSRLHVISLSNIAEHTEYTLLSHPVLSVAALLAITLTVGVTLSQQ
jgi:hypothetical protein